ncbi:MAG: nucleotidyltransferase domain-containing protein [Bacteroidales bacterium]|nr:nucleotidyltransferase domain-containing protein [Bacteroidales bacterium]
MSDYGIKEKSYKLIIKTFFDFPEIEEVILFGSRAMGNYKPGSDIDIAVKGKKVSDKTINKLSAILNQQIPVPYQIDIINFEIINNENLTEHINNHGKTIYLKNKTYINGATSISPQNSLNFNEFAENMLEYEDDFLKSVKPNYKEYMKPIEARRMSKTVKNGIICSQIAMQQAETEMPDAVIFGTGLGIVSDTEKFLEKMLYDNEQYLTPTSFIQSTHNTVAAQIALKIKCHNYNFTYVNRGFSFESALLDAVMHIKEGKKNILFGGGDEMTEHYYRIIKKTGMWKKNPVKNTEFLKYNTTGALCGEAVSFFVLSNEKKQETFSEFKDLKMFYKPENLSEIKNTINKFLSDNNLQYSDIDLIITGHNGDKENDKIFNSVLSEIFSGIPAAYFKHLCGEFQTANAFAFWLANTIIKHQKYPDFIKINDKTPDKIENVLIYNHYFNINHSLILLSKP